MRGQQPVRQYRPFLAVLSLLLATSDVAFAEPVDCGKEYNEAIERIEAYEAEALRDVANLLPENQAAARARVREYTERANGEAFIRYQRCQERNDRLARERRDREEELERAERARRQQEWEQRAQAERAESARKQAEFQRQMEQSQAESERQWQSLLKEQEERARQRADESRRSSEEFRRRLMQPMLEPMVPDVGHFDEHVEEFGLRTGSRVARKLRFRPGGISQGVERGYAQYRTINDYVESARDRAESLQPLGDYAGEFIRDNLGGRIESQLRAPERYRDEEAEPLTYAPTSPYINPGPTSYSPAFDEGKRRRLEQEAESRRRLESTVLSLTPTVPPVSPGTSTFNFSPSGTFDDLLAPTREGSHSGPSTSVTPNGGSFDDLLNSKPPVGPAGKKAGGGGFDDLLK